MQRMAQEDTGQERRRRERMVALTLLGVLLFNYPLLALFGVDVAPFGLPLLFLYLFVAWGLFIWLVARIMAPGRGPGGDPDAARDHED